MDDRDLEARLRTHLHRRFDGAQPPPELVASVQQVIATSPRRVGLPQLKGGSFRPGWSLIAAVLAVAVLAVGGLRFGGLLGPGTGTETPTPHPTVSLPTERHFIVLPPSAELPAKSQSDLALTVLNARLQALGEASFRAGGWAFTSMGGNALQFRFPTDGPSDATVRAVLGASGDVEVVPLPTEDYGEGGLVAEVGKPLPRDEPALFGWDGIASVDRGTDEQDRSTLQIKLRAAAADAFATYTESHIGETFAIVVDGEVAFLPIINAPIPGGEVAISGGGLPGAEGDRFLRALAILVGGRLPESWRGSEVPVTLPRETAEAAALSQYRAEGMRADSVQAAQLDAIRADQGWRAVWRFLLVGEFVGECPMPAAERSNCPTASSLSLVLDAIDGTFISSSSP